MTNAELREILERIREICDANLETTRAICLVEIKRICVDATSEQPREIPDHLGLLKPGEEIPHALIRQAE